MNRVYPNNMRGEQCTSSDAAGFSIASLLFSADELKAGVIDHPSEGRLFVCLVFVFVLFLFYVHIVLFCSSVHFAEFENESKVLRASSIARRRSFCNVSEEKSKQKSNLRTKYSLCLRDPNAPIYGSRWRLKDSYDISKLSVSNQIFSVCVVA